jgi:hypothetical protein
MKEEIDELYLAFETMVQQDEEDSLEEDVDIVCGNIEEKVQDMWGGLSKEKDIDRVKKLEKLLKKFKAEHGLYDEQTELDNMFPNRNDDGFDDDSISYDSVFGDD